jgi:hypothetical protein
MSARSARVHVAHLAHVVGAQRRRAQSCRRRHRLATFLDLIMSAEYWPSS